MLKTLYIQSVRNIRPTNLSLSSRFNLFCGENGSGKTSLLEALYLLGHGKSFRTNILERIIQYKQDSFVVSGTLTLKGLEHRAGIERHRDGTRRIHLNGEGLQQLAEITRQLPLQFIGTDSYRYFSDGPKIRRQFMDWGLFHVKPEFYSLWQQFQRTLKQRNAALKHQLPPEEIKTWAAPFIRLSEALDKMRQEYVDALNPRFQNLLRELVDLDPGELRYSRGWSREKSLETCLMEQAEREFLMGYSCSGPQRADLQLYYGRTPANDVLSQGQQKVTAYALKLAQGQLLKSITGRAPIYLIDDLPSELDSDRRQRVIAALESLGAQVLITAIAPEDLGNLAKQPETQLFHVKHGSVAEKSGAPQVLHE